jgi:hypothetical protein
MPHEFDHLIADLDAAKADLARKVKRARTLIDERSSASDKAVFKWAEKPER